MTPANAQPPPIYLLTHEFYPKHGGIATFAEEMARAAAANGHKIEVWAQSTAPGAEKRWPFDVCRLSIKGTHDLFCRAKSMCAIIKRRRDLRRATVYIPEPGPMLALMYLHLNKSMRPKELILTFHGSEILRMHANLSHRFLMRRLIRHATRISTLTRCVRDLLLRHFPEAAGKIILTPGALRTDMLATATTPAAAAADFAEVATSAPTATPSAPQAQTLPKPAPGKRIVLTVGRIHPRKGHLLTLGALLALPRPLREKTEYWIAGKATRRAHEKKLLAAAAAATAAGLTVRLLGEVPDRDLGDLYARADIFAMTSIRYRRSVEGFGLVYLEASAHGLPIIATAIDGVPEAVQDGETGILVPLGEDTAAVTRQLAAAFEKLLCDETLRHRLGEAGRLRAQSANWADSARNLFAPAAPAHA